MKTLRDELAELYKTIKAEKLSCTMWMYECGEFARTFADLTASGCDNCKRYAELKMREQSLLRKITGSSG